MKTLQKAIFLKFLFLFLFFCIVDAAKSQSNINSQNLNRFPQRNELYFYSGFGSSTMGVGHLTDLTPRTSLVIGASYTTFNASSFSFGESGFPLSFYNLRSELRYYLTSKEKPVSAYLYAAINNNLNTFNTFPNNKIQLEFGGEARFKIGENAFFSVRSSFYRNNGFNNPYYLNPYNSFR